jgi:hypothetical protein
VGQLQDDLLAIHKGTLSGSAAQSKIQSDEAAILSSMGLSQDQINQIQTDLGAVQAAIQSPSSSTSSSTSGSTTTSGSTATSGSASSTGTDASGAAGSSSAVQTAYETLKTDLQGDLPAGGAQPTHATLGQLLDDLDAIRKGTLSGTQAQTTIQTDAAAVLASMGLTQSQIATIQSDQKALQAAIQSGTNPSATPTTGSTSSSSSSDPSSAMQSVGASLIGIPGFGGLGMRGMRALAMPRSMGFGGWVPRGGF